MSPTALQSPVDYPWAPAVGPGVLTVDGFRPVLDAGRFAGEPGQERDPARRRPPADRVAELLDRALVTSRGAGIADRVAVVGVGSNRNPAVLQAKFETAGISPTLALAPVTVDDLAVGHSAHVSARGYVAAAPVRRPGARTELTVAWLDPDQLGALDRTEPNYERVGLAATDGTRIGWVYRSRWGLLADGPDRPLPLLPQPAVQAWLRTVPGLENVWPAGLDPVEVAARLADPGLRDRVREAVAAAGRTCPSGLDGSPPSTAEVAHPGTRA